MLNEDKMTRDSGFVNDWTIFLNKFSDDRYDIFHTTEYSFLFSNPLVDEKAEAFFYTEDDFIFLFPYILKKINQTNLYDFETVYGYSGPCWNRNDPELIQKAFNQLVVSLNEKNVVAGFCRYNPFLKNWFSATPATSNFVDRNIVVMDLTMKKEEILFKQIHHKHRNALNKSFKSNLIFFEDKEFINYSHFIELYLSTMKRLEAQQFYYFDETFFLKIKTLLKDKLQLFCVTQNGKLISSCLTIRHGTLAHYFLSASAPESWSVNPNTFLVYETALALQAQGITQFNLGGGSSGNEDSLYKFKARFSKTYLEHSFGKMLVRKNDYDKLIASWDANNNEEKKNKYGNLFLKYRY